MRKLILFLTTLSILSSCSSNFKESITVNDFSTPKKLSSTFDLSSGKFVDQIKISVQGFIDDTARLGRYTLKPTNVDTTFLHDWYANEYSIVLNPFRAEEGDLLITFEFVVI